MTRQIIALLGRKDEPTDAVEEYCRYLGSALHAHDFDLQIRRVPWEKHGWRDALKAIHLQATTWRGNWVFVQYTALAWSTRGFPQKVLRVLRLLKSSGSNVAVIFHDVEPYPGSRLIDRVRRAAQIGTMRRALRLAELAIFTVPPDKLSWLPARFSNAHFIPVGPNLPFFTSPAPGLPLASPEFPVRPQNSVPTVAVFSITGGASGARETQTIIDAVQHAAKTFGAFRLSVFGRHAELRERALRQGLEDVPVELSVEGVVDPDQVVQKLSVCDLLLFVRGGISSRRSSAIAGIACGLPIIAFSGSETATPLTEAGVLLVSSEQPGQLRDALVRVLSDVALRAELSSRSRAAYQLYFSWPAIAARFSTLLKSR